MMHGQKNIKVIIERSISR